ncbi:hypothetical protein [Domibacillus aminovorans]|uniref:Uncharacterized protein n=1 Tax=Domibacillus aminovorans TaxID=29332 RepID=A0A177L373_9BACI|nr:hypothetical protein [Domibacillus aminovorans]OAH59866.1 hypothetical protein AWH49_18250 [Domibacillus aminovorans]
MKKHIILISFLTTLFVFLAACQSNDQQSTEKPNNETPRAMSVEEKMDYGFGPNSVFDFKNRKYIYHQEEGAFAP